MSFAIDEERLAAFCASACDLIMEVDAQGCVRFVHGDADAVGLAGIASGAKLLDHVPASERGLLSATLVGGAPIRRFGPVRLDTLGADLLGEVTPVGARLAFLSRRDANPAAGNAVRDNLTGLVARSDFYPVFAAALASQANTRFSVIALDGEEALLRRHGADALRCAMRGFGVVLRGVALGDAACRYGAGLYPVLHEASVDVAALERQAHDALGALNTQISLSAVACAPFCGASPGEAAKAMAYTLDTLVRTRRGQLTPALMRAAAEHAFSETAARLSAFLSAIRDGGLDFVRQPIVRMADGSVHHHEVLARFAPEQSPAALIAFAEDAGVVSELDLAALDFALARLAADPACPPLAVNFSGATMESETGLERVREHLARRPVAPERLLVEVTESCKIANLARADHAIQILRARGHRVCLDDFGAGAASFEYLRAMSVDFVKIDGKYVRKGVDSQRDAVLLRAMAQICRDLGIETIAEMVETEDQKRHAANLGIELGQGWLFGRPEPFGIAARGKAA